jgi:hypothetical protein
MQWARHVAFMGEMRNAYRIFSILGRKRSWECNIKILLKQMGCEGMDWIHLADSKTQLLALMNMLMSL